MHGMCSVDMPQNDLTLKAVRSFWSGDIHVLGMCNDCKSIKTIEKFSDPEQYLQTLAYIKELLASEKYQPWGRHSIPIDGVKKENGCWADDFIFHGLKCKECGAMIECSWYAIDESGHFVVEEGWSLMPAALPDEQSK